MCFTTFYKYRCNEETYLIYDPNTNNEQLGEELIRRVGQGNCSLDVAGIVEGPFIEDAVYRMKAWTVQGGRTGLSRSVLAAFERYLKDQKYIQDVAREERKVYAQIDEQATHVSRIGKIYMAEGCTC